MRIGFHSSQLGLRGTEIAMYDYAKYNRELLGNESVIIYPTESANNDIDVKIKFTKQFSLYGYYGIGTLFGDKIYHLYQGRVGVNVELFKNRCNQILEGHFDKSQMYSSLREFNGKVVD